MSYFYGAVITAPFIMLYESLVQLSTIVAYTVDNSFSSVILFSEWNIKGGRYGVKAANLKNIRRK